MRLRHGLLYVNVKYYLDDDKQVNVKGSHLLMGDISESGAKFRFPVWTCVLFDPKDAHFVKTERYHNEAVGHVKEDYYLLATSNVIGKSVDGL